MPMTRTGNTGLFNVYQVWLEHALGCLKAFRANFDSPTIG